jgi:hypothetical protein
MFFFPNKKKSKMGGKKKKKRQNLKLIKLKGSYVFLLVNFFRAFFFFFFFVLGHQLTARAGAPGIGDDPKAAVQITALLRKGATVNLRCRLRHMTPLHYAATFNCPKVGKREERATRSSPPSFFLSLPSLPPPSLNFFFHLPTLSVLLFLLSACFFFSNRFLKKR